MSHSIFSVGVRALLGLACCTAWVGCLEPRRLDGDDSCGPIWSGVSFEGLEQTQEDVPGSRGAASLRSMCNIGTCSREQPLAVGSDHGFYVMLAEEEAANTPRVEELSLTSSAPEVLDVRESAPMSMRENTVHGDGCKTVRWVWVQASMHPQRQGTADIELRRDGEIIDTFEVVVEQPDSVTIESFVSSLDPSVDPVVVVEGKEPWLGMNAKALAADGLTSLVLSSQAVSWRVSDPRVLELVPFFGDGEARPEVQGTPVMATLHRVGTTSVTASIAGLSQTVDVQVADVPAFAESPDAAGEGAP